MWPPAPIKVAIARCKAAWPLAVATALVHDALMQPGGPAVLMRQDYNKTRTYLEWMAARLGGSVTIVDDGDPEALAAAIRPETRLVFAETIGNPGLEVPNLPEVARVAHDHGLPLLVDNTFATPYLCRPFEHGADLVLHSATKWLGGHGLAIGGVLVDGGGFDWAASGKFPTMTEPYPGYDGLVYLDSYGPSAFHMRARTEGLRDFGACMSPQNAFLILQGVETLPLRMARHMANTSAIVKFLATHEAVAYVIHPSLATHADHRLAKRLLPKGAGSIVTFGVKGGRAAGRRFIEGCALASHLANVGDAKTLVIHPASTTHLQVGAEALAAAGVGEDMIRLSVGLEDPADIMEDLGRALHRAQQA